MGDASQFHYGKGSGGAGLEFTGAKKRSLFAQYTTQFNQQHQQSAPQASVASPQAVTQSPIAMDSETSQTEYGSNYQQPASEYWAAQLHSDPSAEAQHYANPVAPVAAQPPSYAQQAAPTQESSSQSSALMGWLDNDDVLSDIPSLKIKHSQKKSKDEVKEQRRSRLKMAFVSLGSAASVAILVLSVMFLMNNRPAIPAAVKQKASFPVYELASNSLFYVDKKSVEINSSGSLVYIVYQRDTNARFVVSQQALPDIVKDDLQYQQFLTDTDKFASFDSTIGKVYFTRPANIGDDISAVLKSDKSLMFIRASGSTSEQTWMNLLNYLKKS